MVKTLQTLSIFIQTVHVQQAYINKKQVKKTKMCIPINTICLKNCGYLVGCICSGKNRHKKPTHIPSETYNEKQVSLVSLTLADLSCLKAITKNTSAVLGKKAQRMKDEARGVELTFSLTQFYKLILTSVEVFSKFTREM